MSEKYKHLEGSVPVNGDITPITRKPISKINSNNWEEMSFEALSDQYVDLQNRIEIVKRMGRPDLEKQMNRGLNYLLQLINEKRPKEDAVTLL